MVDQLLAMVGESERIRFQAARAPWAHGWLQVTPSLTDDTVLSDVVFSDTLSMRLGLNVFQKEEGCPSCHQQADNRGHHVISHMNVGTHTRIQNDIRDSIYRAAHEAGLRPQGEVPGLLPDSPNRRPADVLLPTKPFLKQSSWRRFPSLALDCAVVSPFKISASRMAAQEPAAAAQAYASTKRQHVNTREQDPPAQGGHIAQENAGSDFYPVTTIHMPHSR